jgi:hypothetical protein
LFLERFLAAAYKRETAVLEDDGKRVFSTGTISGLKNTVKPLLKDPL